MKSYEFALASHKVEHFFTPIRSKPSSIKVLMNAIKVMLINQPLPIAKSSHKMVLRVSKMSRLFFFSEEKYYSIHFPFTVAETDDGLQFNSAHLDNINHEVTSNILSIMSNPDVLDNSDLYEFIGAIDEMPDHNDRYWQFIRSLFLFEDGYIRYDYDPLHCKGDSHPLNHLDIFYSSGSTFKLGLRSKMPHNFLIDCLDTKTDCHYIEAR